MNKKADIQIGDLVMVYGSLRDGMGNNRLLDGLEVKSREQIGGFKMYSMGGFPFITHASKDDTITGEIYEVDSESRAQNLDGLEGYPTFYDREQVDTSLGKAWIYFIDSRNTDNYPPVEEGDWVEYYNTVRS